MSFQLSHEIQYDDGSQRGLVSHDLRFGSSMQGTEGAVRQAIATASSNVRPSNQSTPQRIQNDNPLQLQRPLLIRFNANMAANHGMSSLAPTMRPQEATKNKTTIEGSKLWPTRPGSAWGNFSYADLITLAILSSSDRKMTVKEIYAWVARNIPHFDTKKYEPAASGWKNTIRHTLSIRKQFIRIPTQMERRSLWTINPESLHGLVIEISKKISSQPGYKIPGDSTLLTREYDHTTLYPGSFPLPYGAILIPRPSSYHGKF